MAYGRINVGGGANTRDATATEKQILKGYTAYGAAGKMEGSIPVLGAADITPGTADKEVEAGQYLGGKQTVKAVNITAPIADAILTGYNVSVSSNGTSLKSVSGAMPNNGTISQTIAPTDAVQTYTVPKGYHSGSGKVTVSAIRGIETVKKLSNLYMGKGCNSPVCVQTGAYLIVDGGYGAGTTNVAYQEETLTRVSCPAASVQRWKQSGARVGDYAVFAGGSPLQQPQYANVDAYNSSLTKTICAELPEAKESTGAGSVGDYAIFAGGYKYNSSDPGNSYKYSSVTAYNKSLTKVAATALSWSGVTGGTQDANNQRAFFWNGTNVNCYDKSLTRSIPSGLGTSRGDLSRGAALGSNVVIAGNSNNTADVYDIGLTRRSLTLSCKKEYCGMANLRDKFVLIAGGYDSAYMPNVDAIDPSLTVSRAQDLSTGRDFLGSGTIGRYALFMGGQTQGGNTQSAVEVYKLAVTA